MGREAGLVVFPSYLGPAARSVPFLRARLPCRFGSMAAVKTPSRCRVSAGRPVTSQRAGWTEGLSFRLCRGGAPGDEEEEKEEWEEPPGYPLHNRIHRLIRRENGRVRA